MVARRAAPALLAALIACAGPAQWRYEERAESALPEARHGVHAERLRELMGGLERLARERLPRSMDVHAERASRVAEISRVARAIAESAEQVRDASRELDLQGRDREDFLALADALRDRSLALAEDAPALSETALQARTDELETTCSDCHSRFRLPR